MLQVFNSPEGQEIRVVDKDGEPWFVASDVCKALDIGDTSNAVNGNPTRGDGGLDDDERGTCSVSTATGDRAMLIISESGLYSLVFKSRKLEAKVFKRWVTHEVLPSIRKTGGYHIDPRPSMLYSNDPVVLDRLSAVLAHKARLLRELAAVEEFLARGELPPLPIRSTTASSLAPKVTAWVHDFVLPNVTGQSVTTTRAVMEGLGLKASRAAEAAVGRILQGMGFSRTRIREDGVRRYLYIREMIAA